jgi:PAS domain S-box-containing protein
MHIFSIVPRMLTPLINRAPLLLLPALLAAAIAIFIFDMTTPHGYTLWLLYLPLCVLTAWYNRPREAVAASILATILIPVAWWVAQPDPQGLPAIISRLLEVAAIWLCVTIVLMRQRAALDMRAAYHAARDSSNRLSSIIINNSEDAIVCVDSASNITLFNHGAERMFGYSSAEVSGQALEILLPENVARHHKSLIAGFATAPEQSRRMGERGAIHGRRRDGTEFPAEITISKLVTSDGMLFAAILRDISERVNAERQSLEQRQRLRLAMLAGRMGTFDFDDRTGQVRVDETTLRLLHLPLTQTELSYHVFLDRMHPDDRAEVRETLDGARRHGSEFRFEYRLLLGDGSLRWIAARGFGQLDDHEKPLRLLGITYDITERVTAERAIRESEALNRSTLQALPGHIVVVGTKGQILSANQAWIDFVQGRVEDEASRYVGGDYFDLMSRVLEQSSTGAQINSGIRSVLEGLQASFSQEFSLPLSHGQQTFLLSVVPLVYDGTGGAVISHLDITERKQAETLVAEANRALEARVAERTAALRQEIERREEAQSALVRSQKLQAVGELAGGLAHDFNNLLTVITGNLELLSLRNLDDASQDLLRRADEAAKMGARLSSRLLVIGRRHRLQPVPIDLSDIALGMIDMLRRTLGDQIEIRTSFAADAWPALADVSEVENAILNLAINARDAMPSGGVIEVSTGNCSLGAGDVAGESGLMAGDYVMLSVRDNGRGMDMETLSRAFEPYFSTKDTGRGTGLGLSTIYGFAKQSGGHLTIQSKAGEGTTVRLLLPRSKDLPVTVEARPVTPLPLAGERILVVEDNSDVREIVTKRLSVLGYTVYAVENGAAAIDYLKGTNAVNLVFSDVVMPGGISGYDLARWIRSHGPDVRVLLTSGFTGGLDLERAEDSLADTAILKKPYALPELARAVREALS